MKKIIAFVAIIGIVFSSCNGKYTIAKRKYNKGFYVNKSSGTSTKPAVAKTNKIIAPEEKIETVVIAKTEETAIEIAPLKTIASPVMNDHVGSAKKSNSAPAIASTSKNTYENSKEIKPIKIDEKKASTSKKDKSSGGNLVLMIILCFLWWLNLIAVYMHDGGVTTNFWITLLLDIIVIGGIIFSLLVVLDIIDLA